MSVSIEQFDEFFKKLWGYDPFPWQSRLAKQVFKEGWPECIDLPTASGKTACIDIAVFVLACQAGVETNNRTVGRRIFFTVNRRVIVDEAFDRSFKIADRLLKAENGILKEVADALQEVSGDKKAPPLDVAQLRGGIYRDRAWARSITQPIIVCTTADQLGSRLLFRGYGVSPSMQPIHAALTACDSLILLDEAHVTKAFSQTLSLLSRYRQLDKAGPPMRFVQMTATPYEVKNRFGLDHLDLTHPVLKTRQKASKPAELISVGKKTIVDGIVKRAVAAVEGPRQAIGIIVNRVQTARDIHTKLAEQFGDDAHLVIGRMRPIDRDELQRKLRTLVGPDRPDILDKPVFVVATQCLEVGADYDFDALFTECASIDALRQRFGRLNRKGRPIEAAAAIITNDESIKGDDPIYGDSIKHTWEWLWANKDKNDQINFSIALFRPLWEKVEAERSIYLDEECPKPLLSPTQNAAVLLPAHLDALCQTNPQPVPSPDISFFIHGPQRDMAEVSVCWRADLCGDDAFWPEIVRLLPPTSPECITVPLWEVRRWMQGDAVRRTDPDADVPVLANAEEQKASQQIDRAKPPVVVWRYERKPGEDTDAKRRLAGFTTEDPLDLKPGDTVVMPTSSRSWLKLGHIPSATVASYQKAAHETDDEWATRCASLDRSVDLAERATRQSKLRLVIRLHDAFPGRGDLRELPIGELRPLLRFMLEKEITDDDERRRVLAVLDSRFERQRYDEADDDDPETNHNELIVFKTFIDPPNKLELPPGDEDDGEDNQSELNRFVSLDDHTKHVVDRIAAALGKLHLDGLDPAVRVSAPFHDLGKADVRFQAMLAGITPYEAIERLALLGKGDGVRRTRAERQVIFDRAMYPRGFRHEMLSVELIEHLKLEMNLPHRDLLLHLVAAHHGYARPFAPVCFDDTTDDELRSVRVNDHDIPGNVRKAWIPSHRLDSGIAERFWKLTRAHGWWGLAWLESILRLADQQASAAEQEGDGQ